MTALPLSVWLQSRKRCSKWYARMVFLAEVIDRIVQFQPVGLKRGVALIFVRVHQIDQCHSAARVERHYGFLWWSLNTGSIQRVVGRLHLALHVRPADAVRVVVRGGVGLWGGGVEFAASGSTNTACGSFFSVSLIRAFCPAFEPNGSATVALSP